MTLTSIRRICVIVAGFALLALALWMTNDLLTVNKAIINSGQVFPTAAAYEQRYGTLRGLLPAGAVVRYVTNVPAAETRPYYKARFALAPARVAWEGDYDVAVGDFFPIRKEGFSYAVDVAPVLGREGYVVERDMGNGLFLLKKRTK